MQNEITNIKQSMDKIKEEYQIMSVKLKKEYNDKNVKFIFIFIFIRKNLKINSQVKQKNLKNFILKK